MQVVNRKREIGYLPKIQGREHEEASLKLIEESGSISIYELFVPAAGTARPLSLKWKQDALAIKGSWSPNGILDKRFRTDWEMPKLVSSISVDAPVVNLFGHFDENIVTLACSDLIHSLVFEASLREEDNCIYFNIQFFVNDLPTGDYTTKILIDTRKEHFSEVIQASSAWATGEAKVKLRETPPLAKVPLYSTWYAFHQELEEEKLLRECRVAKDLGYDLVIIDDGWQTMDTGRGYDYTGDWLPERFPKMQQFVSSVHSIDMGIMLWYSVPFCGVKSKAYQKFKGKFLTENHHWAPVLDPRFPEVRKYLSDIYTRALLDWNIDGFKLDFIDDFKVYPETELNNLNGRDTLSVSEGTNMLINEIADALLKIKPDVLIEFRQQYFNPALRRLGNMFRAFDCPNDSLMNRVRITDVKLLCGEAAVHSDMITWHPNEKVEVAALQLTNLLFAVPQLSVRPSLRSGDELEMIKFFTSYWNQNKDLLLSGHFKAYRPLSNYPILSSHSADKIIIGIYEEIVATILSNYPEIDIVNGKLTEEVTLDVKQNLGTYKMQIRNCLGKLILSEEVDLNKGLKQFRCPPNGIVYLRKN